MATDTMETQDPPLTSLVSKIISNAQELTQHQLDLFKIEMRDNAQKAQVVGILFAAGAGVGAVAGVLLGLAIAGLLRESFPSLSEWGAQGIVGLLLAAGAAVLFGVCKQKMESFSLLPEKSVDALKENLEWKTKPT